MAAPESNAPTRGLVIGAPKDGGTPLAFTQETIAAAANDPEAIGRLMVDLAQAERGHTLAGHALYYEHSAAPAAQLSAYRTGLEQWTTGDWVRCITSPAQLERERLQLDRAAAAGDLTVYGTHRGVLLVHLHAQVTQSGRGFGQEVAR